MTIIKAENISICYKMSNDKIKSIKEYLVALMKESPHQLPPGTGLGRYPHGTDLQEGGEETRQDRKR